MFYIFHCHCYIILFFYMDNPGVHTLLDLICFFCCLCLVLVPSLESRLMCGFVWRVVRCYDVVVVFLDTGTYDYILLCIYRYFLLRPVGFLSLGNGGNE